MRFTRILATAAAVAAVSCPVQSETRGLIMAIADYPGSAALPGVKKDVELARKLAKWMRVPDGNLTVIQDRDLQLDGFRRTLQTFASNVRPGDDVFLYYSGHGGRTEAQKVGSGATPQCAEAFVAADLQFVMDKEFKTWLEDISARAAKVIVFADSCHSGGVAKEKGGVRALDTEQRLPKSYAKAGSGGGYCEPVNLAKTVVTTRALKTNAVFIAAARDDEVAWATSKGSAASMAWVTCLEQRGLDKDGSGAVTAEELRQCAQQWVDGKNYNQHLSLVGNTQMVLGYEQAAGPTPSPIPVSLPSSASAALLDNLAANGDPKRTVRVTPARERVIIGRDPVDFDVSTSEPGYLYLLYLGSDGKTLDLLFPNRLDADNWIQAGTHRFPRATWRITAGGPVGTDRILAIVSPVRRNFNRLAAGEVGPFSLLLDGSQGTAGARNLMVESLRPDTAMPGDCGTRNLNVMANQRDCVAAYGVGMARIDEIR